MQIKSNNIRYSLQGISMSTKNFTQSCEKVEQMRDSDTGKIRQEFMARRHERVSRAIMWGIWGHNSNLICTLLVCVYEPYTLNRTIHRQAKEWTEIGTKIQSTKYQLKITVNCCFFIPRICLTPLSLKYKATVCPRSTCPFLSTPNVNCVRPNYIEIMFSDWS